MPSRLVQIIAGVLILVLLAFTGVECLFCYRCLSLDCPGEQSECESVRSFVTKNLRDYYEIETFLPACPAINDKAAWSIQQVDEEPCIDFGSGTATCTAGRIQVITKRIDTNPLTSYATVLGCAKTDLLILIKKAKIMNQCDKSLGNGTLGDGLFHMMKVEHCSRLEMVCSDKDFCVEPEESVVKEFRNDKKSIARFEYGLTIGIVVFIVVIIAAVIGAQYCSFPLNRASNLPDNDNGDADSDIIRPRTVRKFKLRDNSEFS